MLLAVVHAHALAAQATQHATLQQRRSLARRPRPPLATEGAGVVGEPPLIGLEAVPVDVALVHARHDELPFRPGDLDDAGAAIGPVAYARAAIDECAGVARIVQHLQDARMLRRRPQEFTLVRPRPQSAREHQTLLPEEADCLDGASGPLEGLEDQTDGVLHLRVGIEADRSVGPVDQADRRAHLELAAPGLVELTTTHARFEDVQLGLAHRAFEAEQEAIVEAGWIVDAVFIEDEGRGQRAQLDEAVPVGRVAGKTRDFQAHDDAGLAERHLADELLEAVARRRCSIRTCRDRDR